MLLPEVDVEEVIVIVVEEEAVVDVTAVAEDVVAVEEGQRTKTLASTSKMNRPSHRCRSKVTWWWGVMQFIDDW